MKKVSVVWLLAALLASSWVVVAAQVDGEDVGVDDWGSGDDPQLPLEEQLGDGARDGVATGGTTVAAAGAGGARTDELAAGQAAGDAAAAGTDPVNPAAGKTGAAAADSTAAAALDKTQAGSSDVGKAAAALEGSDEGSSGLGAGTANPVAGTDSIANANAASPSADASAAAGGNANAAGLRDAAKANAEGLAGGSAAAAAAAAGAGGEAADAGEVLTVDTLEQLEQAVEEEVQVEPARRKKVISSVAKRERPAELANSIGDISPIGACKEELARLCSKRRPGAKRLAYCLRAHIAAAEDTDGDDDEEDEEETGVSEACRKEVESFLEDAAKNVNKDVPLVTACQADIEEHCPRADTSRPGAVLACLRKQRKKLSSRCKKQVFKLQQLASSNLRLDPAAWSACQPDAEKHCQGITPRGAMMQVCLRNRTSQLSWECKAQLFRRQIEDGDDIRLSFRLLKVCLDDKKQFCADVEPGDSRVKDCLEDHMDEDDFSKSCHKELSKVVEGRSANFRLDSKIREFCKWDVEQICGIPADTVASEEYTTQEDSIQKCLQDHRKELKDRGCADRVARMISLTMRDIRFNHPLATSCGADRAKLCGNVPPGSARVIRCLKDKREELSESCAATLFDQEIIMAENIDFQYPMKMACKKEIQQLCGGVRHGRGRVIRCLEEQLDAHESEFSEHCKAELMRYEEAAANDYRLNARLAEACGTDIAKSCGQACGALARKSTCGASVLRCLAERVDSLDDEECRSEVHYFMKMEVKDYKNDVFLAEACRDDVSSLCSQQVKEGHGAVVACLHDKREQLSQQCRKEEIKLSIMQSSSIELRPSIARACRDDWKQHCPDVKPGQSRVMDCLLANADKVDFSEQCRSSLGKLQQMRLMDWRLDYGLRKACKTDVETWCVVETGSADEQNGSVYRCLVRSFDDLEDGCSAELSRAASQALRFYKSGLPGSEACDADAAKLCSTSGPLGTAVGSVKACLEAAVAADRAAEAREDALELPRGPDQPVSSVTSDSSSDASDSSTTSTTASTAGAHPQLSDSCREFMDLADPEDSMAALESSLAASALLKQLAGVEEALGLQAGTLHNKDASGAQVLTLTGWGALLCMLGLATAIIGGVVFAVRRFTGAGRGGYTMVLKHAPPSEG